VKLLVSLRRSDTTGVPSPGSFRHPGEVHVWWRGLFRGEPRCNSRSFNRVAGLQSKYRVGRRRDTRRKWLIIHRFQADGYLDHTRATGTTQIVHFSRITLGSWLGM